MTPGKAIDDYYRVLEWEREEAAKLMATEQAEAEAVVDEQLSFASTILEEAASVTSGDRQTSYGHPKHNLRNTALFWTAYLYRKYGEKSPSLSAEDVAMMMILLKVSRQANAPKRDNLVDIAGWARTVEMLGE